MLDLEENIRKELLRIEEDSEHSAKSHFNAAVRWDRYHFRIGLISTIITATGGTLSLGNCPIIGGVLAIISSSLAAILTFLNPAQRAKTHKTSGDQYLSLQNEARIFREIKMKGDFGSDVLQKGIFQLAAQRNQLNQTSPNIPRKDYELAKADISKQKSKYAVDLETA
ncbi:MAG: SLATT domain-containing protein [Verrucomicrobia bacterium]|nr:SLATT domain-containing protein [Verrucomicrobiota bacterium]